MTEMTIGSATRRPFSVSAGRAIALAAALACPASFASKASAQTQPRPVSPDVQVDVDFEPAPNGMGINGGARPAAAQTGTTTGTRTTGATGTTGTMGTMGTMDATGGTATGSPATPLSPFPTTDVRAPVLGTESSEFNTGNVSVEGGVDYVTSYFFRGYNQEDSRIILQPYGQVNFSLGDVAEGTTVDFYVGTWASLHEQPTLGDSVAYEVDLYGGVNFTFADAFTVGLMYAAYLYPGDAAGEIQEVGLTFGYNDTALLANLGIPFGLNPTVGVFYEVANRNGPTTGYVQFGIEPTVFTLFETTDYPLALSVPVIFGASLDDYYFSGDGSETFAGFLSVGLSTSIPLAVPASFGEWAITGGVEYLYLFAESARAANDDSRDEFLGRVGLSFAY